MAQHKPQTYLKHGRLFWRFYFCWGEGVDVNSAVQVLSVISGYNNVVFHCQKVAHACELIMI